MYVRVESVVTLTPAPSDSRKVPRHSYKTKAVLRRVLNAAQRRALSFCVLAGRSEWPCGECSLKIEYGACLTHKHVMCRLCKARFA